MLYTSKILKAKQLLHDIDYFIKMFSLMILKYLLIISSWEILQYTVSHKR